MTKWLGQRFFVFGVLGVLVNFLVFDFQLQKGAQGLEVWEVKEPIHFQKTDPSNRSRELLFASPKLFESQSESANLTTNPTARNLAINLGEEIYTILGLFIGTKSKTVTLSDVNEKIIELRINDNLPDGRKIKDISLNSLKLKKDDGSLEFIEIYERTEH